MNNHGKRIAIVGAGPGGLATGIALRQAGFDVQIFEKAAQIIPLGGGIILNAPVLTMLRRMGVDVDDIYAAGNTEFKRWDGRMRVDIQIDRTLLEKANCEGWQAGMMRSALYERMLQVIPSDVIQNNHKLVGFTEQDQQITLRFENGATHDFDLLIGADGIHSVVRRQLWGDEPVQQLGLLVWLAWSEPENVVLTKLNVRHNDLYQVGFAPCIHNGTKVAEWWHVQPLKKGETPSSDPLPMIYECVKNWAEPVPQIVEATRKENIFPWIIQSLNPLSTWSKGRATIMGDAAHPTSPYAAYGAGMAIEDGFYLARYLHGRDLSDLQSLQEGLAKYEQLRLPYTNRITGFARTLGKVFHQTPFLFRKCRDFMFDYTPILARQMQVDYVSQIESELKALFEEEKPTPVL